MGAFMPGTTDPSSRRRRFEPRLWNGVALMAAALVTAALHLGTHALKWPDFSGWWAGFDQQAYLTAARAWAAGDLDPALHHYPAGYALLGAPFTGILGPQPFLPADLLCALISVLLLARIARRLAPGNAWAPALGALAFLIATLSSREAMAVWVVPWSTTPAAPLTLAALLCALRHLDAARPGDALGAGAAAAMVGAFRPSDAALLLGWIGLVLAWSALRRLGMRRALGHGGLLALGAALPAAGLLGLHLAVHGWSPGTYLSISALIGFDIALVPQRWVLLALNPGPVFGALSGPGLVVAFPWIIPGVAGIVALLLAPGQRDRHLLVCGAVVLSWLLYLAYRDLHPPSLWRFYNYHYFKWTLPLLALYALLWLGMLARSGARRPALAGAAAALLLLPWRAELRAAEGVAPVAVSRGAEGEARLTLPFPLSMPGGGAVLSAAGPWDGVPGLMARILSTAPGRPEGHMGLGAYPVTGGVLLLPLRALPAEPPDLAFSPAVPLRAEERARQVRLALRPGLPWGEGAPPPRP